MRILIAGAGTIGFNLASALAKEGQDVVVIDVNERRLAALESSVDCQIVNASALSPLVLEETGIRHTDLVVAVTENDAVNMSVCRLADFYGVPRKLARVRNPEFSDYDCPIPPEHFGIDHIISPEGIAVATIRRLIDAPGTREAADFERGRIALRALVVGDTSSIAGERLIDIHQTHGRDFLVGAIRRGSKVLIPGGQEQLRIGDTVYLVCDPDTIPKLVPLFEPHALVAKRVVIFGGGVSGVELARTLARPLERVTLIEPDPKRAARAAGILDELGVEVLNGSALDMELLGRCKLETVDFFVALSDSDEENFMSALLFRKFGSGTPIVMTNQLHYMDILESVDLDIVINPRVLAVSALMRHIRGSTVLSVAKLHSEEAEVLEFIVQKGVAVTRAELKDLQLPRGMLIGAILRAGELIIPRGDTRIVADDRVLVFVDARGAPHAEGLFS